jgi:hypothetical protein
VWGRAATTLTATAGAASDTQALSAIGGHPQRGPAGQHRRRRHERELRQQRPARSETGIDVVIKNADTAQTITVPTFTLSDPTNFRSTPTPAAMNDCFDEIADGRRPGGRRAVHGAGVLPPSSAACPSVMAPNLSGTLIVGGANTNLTLMVQGNAVSALSITPRPRTTWAWR